MIQNTYQIFIENHCPYNPKVWREILESVLSILEEKRNFSLKNCILNLIVVEDNDMISYNQEQMGAFGPTNVLSFPEEENFSPFQQKNITIQKMRTNLGTLIFSTQTLLREAFLFGQNPHEHARRLLCHGIAHLLGYDHGDEMWELTDFLEEELQKKTFLYSFTPIWSL